MVRKFWNFIWNHRKSLVIFGLLFFIFFLNTFHEEYPDEYDSMVGGKYILQGKLPYKDWFQHHQPGAYMLASFILPFSGTSFVRYRIGLAFVFFAINIGTYFLLKKRAGETDTNFYIVYLFIAALAATYYWGQMLLADTLAAMFLIPAYALLLIKGLHKVRFEIQDLLFVSVFTFLTWFTSMTYLFVIVGFILFSAYRYLSSQSENHNKSIKKILWQVVVITITPYIIFFLFIILTGSLKEYYFANITYNQNYYIYNYPRPRGTPVNPVRYAIVIAHDVIDNYFPALAGAVRFPLADPFNTTLAVGNISVFVYILVRRKYAFIFPWIILLIYGNARSNPQAIRETDYQASVYILTSLLSATYVISLLKRELDVAKLALSQKILMGGLLSVLVIYWSFNNIFIGLKFFIKFYDKYMGKAPLIYDRPEVAPILNKLVTGNDMSWVGPFEFKELFYLNTHVPSKYHWFLDHAAESQKIKSELLADFSKNRPKIIVFRRNYTPWGGDARSFNYFFTDFLDQNYFRIFELNQKLVNVSYKWKIGNTDHFELDGTFNFDKQRQDEIIQQLLDLGIIEKTTKS